MLTFGKGVTHLVQEVELVDNDAVAALESPGGVHLLGYGYGAALALRVYSSSVVSGGAVRGNDGNSPCNPM